MCKQFFEICSLQSSNFHPVLSKSFPSIETREIFLGGFFHCGESRWLAIPKRLFRIRGHYFHQSTGFATNPLLGGFEISPRRAWTGWFLTTNPTWMILQVTKDFRYPKWRYSPQKIAVWYGLCNGKATPKVALHISYEVQYLQRGYLNMLLVKIQSGMFSIFYLGAKNHWGVKVWCDWPGSTYQQRWDVGTSPGSGGWGWRVDGWTRKGTGWSTSHQAWCGFLVLRGEKGRENLAPWVCY